MKTRNTCAYSHTVGLFSDLGRGFQNPVDVAIGRDGLLFVLCRAQDINPSNLPFKRITMLMVNGDYMGEFSGVGTEDGKMMWPVTGLVDENDELYISDEALHRISIFTKDGTFLRKWGVMGQGEGQFNGPAGMAFDPDRNLVIVDSLNNRIQRYTADGRYLGGWGREGNGDGEFNMPWGLTVDRQGNVYVADWRNDRIQKFDAQGKHLATWGSAGQGEGQFNRPSGVAVDDDGDIYVSDWGNERVQVLDPDGGFVMELQGEATLSTWADDYFVSNPREHETRLVADLEPDPDRIPDNRFRPKSALIEKIFWGPTSVKTDSQGKIYIADSGRHRIQIYQKQG